MALKSKKLEDVRLSVPVSEVQKEVVVRVNLNVPESLREKWKVAAIARKVTLAELVIEAVELHLNK